MKRNRNGVELGSEGNIVNSLADKSTLPPDGSFNEPAVVQVNLMPQPMFCPKDAVLPILWSTCDSV